MRNHLLSGLCLALPIAVGCTGDHDTHAAETSTSPAPKSHAPTTPPPHDITPQIPPVKPPAAKPETPAPTPDRPNTDQPNSDRTVEQNVRQALANDASLPAGTSNITVTAQGGTVTLKGTVKSEEDKTAVEARVKSVPGVTDCDNQLVVKPD